MVQRKEAITARRETLFDIDYGPASLYKNDSGMIVKPVLPAYRHFELVRMLTDERSLNVQHYLDHECFILGMHDGEYAACPSGPLPYFICQERGTTPLQKIFRHACFKRRYP